MSFYKFHAHYYPAVTHLTYIRRCLLRLNVQYAKHILLFSSLKVISGILQLTKMQVLLIVNSLRNLIPCTAFFDISHCQYFGILHIQRFRIHYPVIVRKKYYWYDYVHINEPNVFMNRQIIFSCNILITFSLNLPVSMFEIISFLQYQIHAIKILPSFLFLSNIRIFSLFSNNA